MGVGYSTVTNGFESGQTCASRAKSLLEAKNQTPSKWAMVFCGGRHDSATFVEGVQSVLGSETLVIGCCAVGCITYEGAGYTGYECSIALFPEDVAAPVICVDDGMAECGEHVSGRRLGTKVKSACTNDTTVILIYDCIKPSVDGKPNIYLGSLFCDGFYKGLGDQVHPTVMGMGALGDMQFTVGYIFDGSKSKKHSAMAVVVPDIYRSDFTIMHGCRPVSSLMEVTKVEGPVVYELDGKPALDVICEMVGLDRGTHQSISLDVTLGAPFGADIYDEANCTSRLIVATNEEDGSIILFEADFKVGTNVYIMSRSNDHMIESAERETKRFVEKLAENNVKPEFAMLFDCAGRSGMHSGCDREEADYVLKNFPRTVPFLGGYIGVEIAPIGGKGKRAQPLDWTSILVVFSRAQPAERVRGRTNTASSRPFSSVMSQDSSVIRGLRGSPSMEFVDETSDLRFDRLSAISRGYSAEFEAAMQKEKMNLEKITDRMFEHVHNEIAQYKEDVVESEIEQARNRLMALEAGRGQLRSPSMLSGEPSFKRSSSRSPPSISVRRSIPTSQHRSPTVSFDSEKSIQDMSASSFLNDDCAMYKKRCNEMGIEMQKMRRELVSLRYSEHRSQILSELVSNGYSLLSENLTIEQLGKRFLEQIIQGMMVRDKVAVMVYYPQEMEFRPWFSHGFASGKPLGRFQFKGTPESFMYCNSKSSSHPEVNVVAKAFGTPYILWTYDADSKTAMIMGSPVEDPKFHLFCEEDHALCQGAHTVFLNLNERKDMDARKDAFLANCSHELKTPLNAIIGISECVISNGENTFDKATIEDLELISSSGKRLANLVSQLLCYSTIQIKGTELTMCLVDIGRLVTRVMAINQIVANEKGVTITSDCPDNFLVRGDANRLEQVYTNIVQNAVKFTSFGGTVSLSCSQVGNSIVVKVSDTGCGIAADKLKSVFNEFEQGDAFISRSHGGVGLGLTISKDLTEMHDGVIEVVSEVGRGSTFSVILPVGQKLSEDEEIFRVPTGRENRGVSFGVEINRIATQVVSHEPKRVAGSVISGDDMSVITSSSDVRKSMRSSLVALTSALDPIMAECGSQTDVSGDLIGTQHSANSLKRKSVDVKRKSLIDKTRQLGQLLGSPEDPHGIKEKKRPCILVVDDEPLNLRVLQNYLSRENYELTLCESGVEALTLVKKNSYQLILMDVMMPKMSGLEACQVIRETYSVAELPIILVTAMNRDSDLLKGFLAGANDYITKPFQKQEVTARMKVHLELGKSLSDLESMVNHSNQVSRALVQTVKGMAAPTKAAVPDGTDYDQQTKEWLAFEFCRPQSVDLKAKWPDVDDLKTKTGKLQLKKWEFDVWEYNDDELLNFIVEIFQAMDVVDHFNVDMVKMRAFLLAVKQGYRDNPYHNFRHAFDVLQTVYFLLINTHAGSYLSYNELFAILIAAICHDLDHPGLSNNYQINSLSQVALVYNDSSVLESYHCSQTWQLLMKEGCDILSGLDRDNFMEIRRIIISSIIATDMADHFSLLQHLREIIDEGFDKESADHRRLLTNMVLHTADLSNPAKPWALCRKWADQAVAEFLNQGDVEKKNGLPVSPYMDRDTINIDELEVNFIDFVVEPVYECMNTLLPEMTDLGLLGTLATNRQMWAEMLSETQCDAAQE